jgi:hypothetical protein
VATTAHYLLASSQGLFRIVNLVVNIMRGVMVARRVRSYGEASVASNPSNSDAAYEGWGLVRVLQTTPLGATYPPSSTSSPTGAATAPLRRGGACGAARCQSCATQLLSQHAHWHSQQSCELRFSLAGPSPGLGQCCHAVDRHLRGGCGAVLRPRASPHHRRGQPQCSTAAPGRVAAARHSGRLFTAST